MVGEYLESEIQEGEIFLGNTVRDTEFPGEGLSSLITIRKGGIALDIKGKELPEFIKPVFIHKSEYDNYNKLMDKKFQSIR